MTPIQIKKVLKEAVKLNDPMMAWDGVKALIVEDMFIGKKANLVSTWTGDIMRRLTYDGRCNYCSKMVKRGTNAPWLKDIGTWCDMGCYEKWTEV